jgi:hypothetical protein
MSASLGQRLDLVARRVRLRPGEVIEKLLEEDPSGHDQLRPFTTAEPLTDKRTFRLSSKTHARLQKLVEKHSIAHGGDGPDVSEVIRRVLVQAFKELGIWDGGEAPSGEEAEGPAARTVAAAAVAAPLWQTGGWAGKLAAVFFLFFIAFLPVLASWMPDEKPPKPPTPRD